MIREESGIRTYPSGREVCTNTKEGREEYRRRREQMYWRDKGECCICGEKIATLREATFEHTNGRGMGGSRRDDRIEHNGVAHFMCNVKKGGSRLNAVLGSTEKSAADGERTPGISFPSE